MPKVITIDTINQDISGDKPVLLKFGAHWCAPCRALDPVLAQLEQENPDILFLEVNADQSPDLAARFMVRALPTMIGLKNGIAQWTLVGALSKSDLQKRLDSLISRPAT